MQKNVKSVTECDVIVHTPFGLVGIVSHGMQIDILFLSSPVNVKSAPSKIAQQVADQVKAYLINPHRDFNLPLVYRGTAFQRRVWSAISAIPSGQTRTYSQLASMLGSGPRAVANACGANHLPLVVPCHRVVAKTGLGGFMRGLEGGIQIKQWLLKHEGALTAKGQVKQESKAA